MNNPRHSTGVREPVPSIDEGLLGAIGGAMDGVYTDKHAMADHAVMSRKLLQSEPMIRLFSIWTATVAAQRDQYADQWEAATAEVERLRAAPQLPDVGPVTRISGSTLSVDGVEVWEETSDSLRRGAARSLAVAAFLDAEAAAPDNDDEHAAVADIAFPMQVLGEGQSWVKGVVVADAEGHPMLSAGEGPEAVALAEWFRDAANAHRARSAEGGVTA